jgi:hypothetical protein
MATDNEQTTVQGVAERFAQAAEELRLTGRQLYRDGIVANDQVLSKITHGWQKPTKKAIELFCQKYGVSAAWMYTGEGNMYIGRTMPFAPTMENVEGKLFYNTDFKLCIDNQGEPIPNGEEKPIYVPQIGVVDFWCLNLDDSLAPAIMPGDMIALKKFSTWKEYLPGDFDCIVVTNGFKVLRKVSAKQDDEQSIVFIQMIDGKPVESKIPKNIIVEIYSVVCNLHRR